MSYVKVKLFGFNEGYKFSTFKTKLKDNKRYKISDKIINEIYINDDLEYIELFLNNGFYYEDNIEYINHFLQCICFSMIKYNVINFYHPFCQIEAYTKNPKNYNNIIKDNIKLEFKTKEKILSIGSEDFYKNILENKPLTIDPYEKVLKILLNKDMTTQFLALYEYLRELVGKFYKKEPDQKMVSNYFKKERGCKLIETKKTDDNGNKKIIYEDIYTNTRTRISHSNKLDSDEYDSIDKCINIEIIKDIIKEISILIEKNN